MIAERLGEEPFGRGGVATLGHEGIEDLAVLVAGAVDVPPYAGDLHIGLDHEPPVADSSSAGPRVGGAWSPGMDLDRALDFAAGRRNALLTTLRRDGRPQQSVIFYVLDGREFTISLTADRAKTKNLRRDPRAALFVPSDDVFMWAGFDGHVDLSDVAMSPEDAVADRLVEYYRQGHGEHDDWSAYRQALVDDQRLVATLVPTSATGILPS